ncbi:MAG TPA: hypothetical protein VD994_13205 [Prosthecobacter sp.]|nr:hypothetical protein [Prosthecobacter sp.]
MNLLYPKITWRQFVRLLMFGVAGAVIAGLYGVVHDQVTYTLAPEYFTRLKFGQFAYLNRAQPVRVIVAEIGFLATWWVGFFSMWFMGRITVPHESPRRAAKRSFKGVMMIVVTALASAIIAYAIAPEPGDERLMNWGPLGQELGITNLSAFVRVAYIHNGSYLGGLLGLIGALVWLRVTRRPAMREVD